MKILLGSKNFEMRRTSVVKEPKKCANCRTENAEFRCSHIQTKMKYHYGSNANTFHFKYYPINLLTVKMSKNAKKLPLKLAISFYY